MNFDERIYNLANACDTFKKALSSVPDNEKVLKEQVSYFDKALADLDHELELSPLNAIELTKLVKRRKDILLERRIAKNEFYRVNAIHNQLKATNLRHVLNNMDKIVISQGERKYKPRVLMDLKISNL
jgi:hypothetical protein